MVIAALCSSPALARTGGGLGSVVHCDASGHSQAKDAVIGGVAGAVIGNNVSHSRSAPVVGALAGAAVGSYEGCKHQRKRAARRHHVVHHAHPTH